VIKQSKDYHNGTRLDTVNLKEHAKQGQNKLLDALFGEKRLLSVPGAHGVVVGKGNCKSQRDFMPFAANKSEILTTLLGKLESQHNVRNRIKTFAVGWDAEGNVVGEREVLKEDV
jgi:hypothetical protein